jgi:hypothetical protein
VENGPAWGSVFKGFCLKTQTLAIEIVGISKQFIDENIISRGQHHPKT